MLVPCVPTGVLRWEASFLVCVCALACACGLYPPLSTPPPWLASCVWLKLQLQLPTLFGWHHIGETSAGREIGRLLMNGMELLQCVECSP